MPPRATNVRNGRRRTAQQAGRGSVQRSAATCGEAPSMQPVASRRKPKEDVTLGDSLPPVAKGDETRPGGIRTPDQGIMRAFWGVSVIVRPRRPTSQTPCCKGSSHALRFRPRLPSSVVFRVNGYQWLPSAALPAPPASAKWGSPILHVRSRLAEEWWKPGSAVARIRVAASAFPRRPPSMIPSAP